MQNQNAIIIDQPSEVTDALSKVGLTKQKIIRIAKAASFARAEYLPNVDPVNFPGTRAYQEGTRQLRLQTLPDGWKTRKFNNIELVYNEKIGLMVGFQNVDCACASTEPQAISSRGEGTKQLVSMPYQRSLFSNDSPSLHPRAAGHSPSFGSFVLPPIKIAFRLRFPDQNHLKGISLMVSSSAYL